MKYSFGFTLIELSIVLVIIGLISGGILLGSDLIRTAEIYRQIKQIEELQTATNTFRVKYNCLPGDCANAVNFGFGTVDSDNGDGNQIVYTDIAGDRLANQEAVNFWYHLSAAQLIAETFSPWVGPWPIGAYKPGIQSPALKLKATGTDERLGGANNFANITGGVWIAVAGQWSTSLFPDFSHAWFLTTTTADLQWFGAYAPQIVYRIDTKIDNGLPLTGLMGVLAGYYFGAMTPFYYTSAGYSDACVDDLTDPPSYNADIIESTLSSLCSPLIKADF